MKLSTCWEGAIADGGPFDRTCSGEERREVRNDAYGDDRQTSEPQKAIEVAIMAAAKESWERPELEAREGEEGANAADCAGIAHQMGENTEQEAQRPRPNGCVRNGQARTKRGEGASGQQHQHAKDRKGGERCDKETVRGAAMAQPERFAKIAAPVEPVGEASPDDTPPEAAGGDSRGERSGDGHCHRRSKGQMRDSSHPVVITGARGAGRGHLDNRR